MQWLHKIYNNRYLVLIYLWIILSLKTSVGPKWVKKIIGLNPTKSFAKEVVIPVTVIYYGTMTSKPVQILVGWFMENIVSAQGSQDPIGRIYGNVLFPLLIYIHEYTEIDKL